MQTESALTASRKRGRPRLGPRCCVCEFRWLSIVQSKAFCMVPEPPKAVPEPIARGDGQDQAPPWCPRIKGDI